MNKNLLVIGFVWPEPKSSAAGSRMLQLISFFQLNGYSITFASSCAKTDNAFDLNSIGIKQSFIELNNSSFDEFVKELNPSIVVFDRFMIEEQYGWRVTENCPNTLKILDTEDLHCLRKGRQQAFKDNKEFNQTYLFNDIAKREIASIFRCDISLIISKVEIDILINEFKVDKSLLVYLPFMVDAISKEFIEKLPDFNQRNHFVTIGNFLHEPNYNAVLFLKEIIWPLIKIQLPAAEIHIYGAYVSQKVNHLQNEKEGFLIKGFTNDVNLVMQYAKVCLAPIRFGAGLKGKLIDAMINGTPSVMTSIASEGMFGTLDSNGFIEDSPEEFVNKAVQLFQNEDIWKEKQNYGFEIINQCFNINEHQKNLLEVIENSTIRLNQKRLNNFTGQMLNHHIMQSTKFMSKWIEEKNYKKE